MESSVKYVAIVGEVGSGKSSFTNILTDSHNAVVGDEPDGVTKDISFIGG